MKKLFLALFLVIPALVGAQTDQKPSISETMTWLNGRLAFGLGVARAEFVEKNCGLCFYTKTGVTGTCVHLANIDPEQISAGDNGSGGRKFNLVAKPGLHAGTSTNKNGVATNASHFDFEFRPEANSNTFDQDMIGALKMLVSHCSK